jgi:hypothetical protein
LVRGLAVLAGLLALLAISLPSAGCKTCNAINQVAEVLMQRQLSEGALDLRGGAIELCGSAGCSRCAIDEKGEVARAPGFPDVSCRDFVSVTRPHESPSRISWTIQVAPEGEQTRFQLRVFDAAGRQVYEGEGVAIWTDDSNGCHLVPESRSI